MTALIEDTPLTQVIGEHSEVSVAATAEIFEGSMVGDSAGYGRALVKDDKFRGHCLEYIDNEDGGAGDAKCELLVGRYRLKVTLTGVLITDVDKCVYASDDATLTFVADGNSWVGRVVRYVTTNTAIVEFNTNSADPNMAAYANTAQSTSVENLAVETDFDKSVTLDGKRFKKGDVIHVQAQVFVEDQNAADTLTLILYAGTEEIWNSGAIDVADNDIGFVDVYINVAAIGVTGKLIWSGVALLGVPGTEVLTPFGQTTAAGETEDISGDVPVKMSATWSAAHVDNECELRYLLVEILNAKAA